MKGKKSKFVQIHYDIKKKLNLTLNEYALLELVYFYSTNPQSSQLGWCYASKKHLADCIDVSSRSVINLLSKLENNGFIEKSMNGRLIKTTKKWNETKFTHYEESSHDGEESSHMSEESSHKNGEESSHRTVKKVHTNNIVNKIDVNKIINNTVNNELVFPFDSNEFLETWNLWKNYRQEIKKPIKGIISEQSQLQKLSKISNGDQQTAIEIINQSISNNWQGLFEIKKQKSNSTDVAMKLIQDIENGDVEI